MIPRVGLRPDGPSGHDDAGDSTTTRALNAALRYAAVASLLAGSALALDPAQPVSSFRLRIWTMRDGLPQSSVNALSQDGNGFLWLATYGGLARFDGRRFALYPSEGTAGLRSDRVTALARDATGALWIGTEDGGLFRESGKRFAAATPADGIGNDRVLSLAAGRGGAIWAATGHGLLCFDGAASRRLTRADGLQNDVVNAAREGADGGVWVGTQAGLDRIEGNRVSRVDLGRPRTLVRSLAADRDGSVWVGTAEGLVRAGRGPAERIPLPGCQAPCQVTALLVDSAGALWAGTVSSSVFRVFAGRAERLSAVDRTLRGRIQCFFEDREGSLWFGMDGGGLGQIAHARVAAIGGAAPVLRGAVRAVVDDGAGGYWVGTYGRGLAHVTPSGITFPEYRTDAEACARYVEALLRDADGSLWIGGQCGLFRLVDGTVVAAVEDVAAVPEVLALVRDREARLLVGTVRGLSCLDEEQRVLRPVPDAGIAAVRGILIGDTTWLATDAGVREIARDGVRVWDRPRGLPQDRVRALFADDDGSLWVGSYGGGLSRISHGRLFSFGPEHGLPDRTVSFIGEDAHGRLWLTGNLGVFSVARSELDVIAEGRQGSAQALHLAEADGMITRECNGGSQPAAALLPNGTLVAATVDGIAVISTDPLLPAVPPAVLVDRFRVAGRGVAIGDEVVLAPGARNIEIEYVAPSFLRPESTYYRYRLEPFDESWVQAGTRNVAYYSALPPGRFRFRVEAAAGDGGWSREGAPLLVTAPPAHYQRWWFRLACAVALVAVFGAAVRLRTSALRARERWLSQEVEARTIELGRLNALLAAQATHDPLTGLHNRRHLDDVLPRELARCLRHDRPLTIAIADIDHFKRVNDTHGHDVGDRLLQELAALMQGTIRAGDLAVRLGGEEFVLVLPDSPACGVLARLDALRTAAAGIRVMGPAGWVTGVSISIGVAQAPDFATEPAELMRAADGALYTAKRMGRDRITVFSGDPAIVPAGDARH